MADYVTKKSRYPNGGEYEEVSLDGIRLGALSPVEGGYTSFGQGWRKPAPTRDAALEKLRLSEIARRRRSIAALQAEIDKLTAAGAG
jgi:hypothetical protein